MKMLSVVFFFSHKIHSFLTVHYIVGKKHSITLWSNAAIDIPTVCQISSLGASKAPFFLALELSISELD